MAVVSRTLDVAALHHKSAPIKKYWLKYKNSNLKVGTYLNLCTKCCVSVGVKSVSALCFDRLLSGAGNI